MVPPLFELQDIRIVICIYVKSLRWRCDIIGRTCDWLRVSSGGQYFWFGFRLSKLVGFCCMGSSVWVCVHVCVRFSSIFDDSREMFVGWRRAVCPAKQCVGNVDSKISVELWWTSYQFIHVSLGWFTRCCRITGVSCSHISQEGVFRWDMLSRDRHTDLFSGEDVFLLHRHGNMPSQETGKGNRWCDGDRSS